MLLISYRTADAVGCVMSTEEIRLALVFRGQNVPSKKYYSKMTVELPHENDTKFGITLRKGVVVRVEEQSEFKALIEEGDLFLTVNGQQITAQQKFSDLIKQFSKITLVLLRFKHRLPSEPVKFPANFEQTADSKYEVCVLYGWKKMPLGLQVKTDTRRAYVSQVFPESVSSQLLRVGDAIITIEDQEITTEDKVINSITKYLDDNGRCHLVVESPVTDAARANIVELVNNLAHVPAPADFEMPEDALKFIPEALECISKEPTVEILRDVSSKAGIDRIQFPIGAIATEHLIGCDNDIANLMKCPPRAGSEPPLNTTIAEIQPMTPVVTQNNKVDPPAKESENEKNEKKEKDVSAMGKVDKNSKDKDKPKKNKKEKTSRALAANFSEPVERYQTQKPKKRKVRTTGSTSDATPDQTCEMLKDAPTKPLPSKKRNTESTEKKKSKKNKTKDVVTHRKLNSHSQDDKQKKN